MDLSLVSDDGDVVRLSLAGKVRQSPATILDKPFGGIVSGDAYSRKVLLDLSQTEFLGSGGMSWLLVCTKRAKEQGGRFVLHSISPMAMKELKLVRFNEVLDIADNEQQALERLKSTPA